MVAECVAEPLDPDSNTFSTYWVDRGILMEEEARNWYEFDQDIEVDLIGLVRGEGNLAFSPDGFVGGAGMVEFKCPKPSTHIKYLMDGGLPDEYKAQVHGGLVVCEREWCDFVSYCPGIKPLVVRVEPDEFTEQVAEVLSIVSEKIDEVRELNPVIVVACVVVALAAAYSAAVTRPVFYVCEAKGFTITVTEKELRRDSLLIFGWLEDGRKIAISRVSIAWCDRWTRT